jgi:hypothetical protein
MPIASSDVLIKTSISTGTAGNQSTQTTAGSSLGKYISTSQITDATLNNLFPDVTGDENAASNVDYQCVFVHNNHGSLTLQSPVIYISAEVAGGVSAAIAVDSTASSALGSASAQSLTIANKNTAPAAISFSSPTTKATGLSLGNIANGNVKAFWIRRTAANTAAVNSDGATVTVAGDTAA